jgi:hypothetical protein
MSLYSLPFVDSRHATSDKDESTKLVIRGRYHNCGTFIVGSENGNPNHWISRYLVVWVKRISSNPNSAHSPYETNSFQTRATGSPPNILLFKPRSESYIAPVDVKDAETMPIAEHVEQRPTICDYLSLFQLNPRISTLYLRVVLPSSTSEHELECQGIMLE